MEKLFERHNQYISNTPDGWTRKLMQKIDWSLPLISIKGPKGVGKSTLMLQYIKQHFHEDDHHALYCSADTGYFTTHTLVDTAEQFYKAGGTHLFIDEIHKYQNWGREIKEIFDLYHDLHLVISGSSLLQFNDGQADLSRRMIDYNMYGLSFREYLWFDKGIAIEPISLKELLKAPNAFCKEVKSKCRPLEFFHNYLQGGYYPYYFDNKGIYPSRMENVINYIIDTELTLCRNVEMGNTRQIKTLLQILSQIVPYEVDIAKLSKNVGIQRTTTLKYLKHMEEAALIRRLYTELNSIGDMQKPNKILLDNPNLLYTLSNETPQIGTIRETFFCNQLAGAGHKIEYGGLKHCDFRIDDELIIEVEGKEKGFLQVKDDNNAYVAADDIDSATHRKIPLWAFGFLY